ncbi:hypothetical protein PP747_gp093 [Rhizobium phage RHph_Y38]|uniref:Uncharacterized protein n=2 Tax=Acanvirus TaxID=3044653 RepID=A0A7S5USP3_9CAUD|nr:hypothetical protein PP747_gp093 [Rhizobium phage RHph_Y38]YP_010658302.1 hypothetical protein PP749_gp091 [Rhizobium phage RHEph22]QIG67794.1 hypothetical protein EVB52_093 [Rhizobium phage RHph_Y38]QXV74764.1 hypothetical protein [Rhizobium phage RHEph22]
MITEDELKAAMPSAMKTLVTTQMVNNFNAIAVDPEFADTLRDNVISYASVMKDGKYKIADYLSAVMYVSYKAMGYNNQEAYSRTHPQRYANLLARGATQKDISAYVAAYHKNQLVNKIMEFVAIPTWVLNQDIFQKAINVQADLMLNAQSEKVRMEAADSLLTHLKRPEVKGLEVKISTEDNSGMNELKNTLREVAEQQKRMIEGGVSAKVVAHSRLIDAEVVKE